LYKAAILLLHYRPLLDGKPKFREFNIYSSRSRLLMILSTTDLGLLSSRRQTVGYRGPTTEHRTQHSQTIVRIKLLSGKNS